MSLLRGRKTFSVPLKQVKTENITNSFGYVLKKINKNVIKEKKGYSV